MLLPNNHHFTTFFATCIHEQCHSGVTATVSKIPLKLWVIRLKIFVKSIVNKCVKCKAYRRQMQQQVMGPL